MSSVRNAGRRNPRGRAATRPANDVDAQDEPEGADALFAVPPDRFVAARNALAAELGARGDERAAAVKKLRRPSPSAWLVNVLVREARPEIEALFRAGDALRHAQTRLLEGAAPDVMHTAAKHVREALGKVLLRARAILRENDRRESPDLTRRITHVLRSASVDRALRGAILQGRLRVDPEDEAAPLETITPKRVGKPPPAKPIPAKKANPRDEAKERARLAKERARVAREAAREQRARDRAATLRANAEAKRAREAERRRHVEAALSELEDAKHAHEHARRALRAAEGLLAEKKRALAKLER